MPIIIALVVLPLRPFFLIMRARRGAEMTSELLDVGRDVAAAARRFGFRRKTNMHPEEGIDDPQLAVGAIAQAFLELDDLPTADARKTADLSLRKHQRLNEEGAREIAVLGRWLVDQRGGAAPARPKRCTTSRRCFV